MSTTTTEHRALLNGCTCGHAYSWRWPDRIEWWAEHLRDLGHCCSCEEPAADGPTDSNGDHWCGACADEARSQKGATDG